VLDGSERVDRIIQSAMLWDVMSGVARRSWARNPHAMEVVGDFNAAHDATGAAHITVPQVAPDDDALIDAALA
jgi:urocanate hydratase